MPTCIYNNTKNDRDARWLEKFKEPAWNNPVVRIVDTAHTDVVSRLHDDWSLRALAATMTKALRTRKQVVPAYLHLLEQEEIARKRGVESAVFGMS